MQDYVIIRVSWKAVFQVFFAAGTCLGGSGGIVLGLMLDSSIGLLGGMFLGLVAGLISGLAAAAYAAVFNALAPYFGGIAVTVTTKAVGPDAAVPGQEPPAAGTEG